MDNNLKLLEIQQILIVNNKDRINSYFEKYKNDLNGFKYIDNKNYFDDKKNLYIRYVGFNNKLYYGGFFVKVEHKNNSTLIYLINTKKKIWTIDFNKYFVFINKVISEDDKIRKAFIDFLEKNKN